MNYANLITAAMQNSLAAIRQGAEKFVGIFATDIMQNVKLEKYYPAATAGECTPFAYDEAGTAQALFGLLATVADSGQDFTYQPQLGISDELKGRKVLLFTHNQVTPKDEANMIIKTIPEDFTFEELLREIGREIEATGAKIVIIDDLAGDARWCGNAILWDLNELADSANVILLAGFMLNHETDEVSSWLATHAHNLWQLTAGSLSMSNEIQDKRQPYFCLSYGHPTPKRIYYGIDEEGNACTVSNLLKLLRIKELAQQHAQQWISLKQFKDICFGALAGEFEKRSIDKAVSVAADFGIITKSGGSTKANIIYADGKMSRNTCINNTALTAKGNPYTSPKHTKKSNTILRHGEFRLLAPEDGCENHVVRDFTFDLMGAIVTGNKWLDFDVKTPFRNTLCIIMGADDKAVEWTHRKVQIYGEGATFTCMALPKDTTDQDFLTAYKQAIDTAKPQFVFIVCYNRIAPGIYTEAQLAKEIAIYSKKKGICTIAESEKEIDREAYELGDAYWCIAPLVKDGDRLEIAETHGISLPFIYSFKGSVGSFDFLCRFKWERNQLVKPKTTEQQRAFLIGTFYWANDTEPASIEEDCTGNPLTNRTISQAQKLGLIKVHYTSEKKKLMESRITFVGE